MSRRVTRNKLMFWGLAAGTLVAASWVSGCTRHAVVDDTPRHTLIAEDYMQQDGNHTRQWWQGYTHRFDAEKLKLRGGGELLQHITRVDGRLLGWVTEERWIDGPGGMFGASPGLPSARFHRPPIFTEVRRETEHEEVLRKIEQHFQRGVEEGQYVEAGDLLDRVASVHNSPLCTLMFGLPLSESANPGGEFAREWAEVHICVAACEWWPDDFAGDEYGDGLREVRLYIACDASVHHILLFPEHISVDFLRACFELTTFHVDYDNWDELEEVFRKLYD
jgi:hypothetical protein